MVTTLPDPRTIAGDDSSGSSKQLVARPVDILHRSNRLVGALGWYVGRLKLLTGIVTLAAATAILSISGRKRTGNPNSEVSFRMVPLILAALGLLLLANRHRHKVGIEHRVS